MTTFPSIRDIRCEMVGCLITLKGTVIRLSEMRHELKSTTFKCLRCGESISNVHREFKFTEPVRCIREHCGNRISWELKTEDCHFTDWQQLKYLNKSIE